MDQTRYIQSFNNSIGLISLIVVFYLLLVNAFVFNFSVWGYYGLVLDLNYFKLFESLFLILFLSLFIRAENDRPYNYALFSILVLIFIPISAYYSTANQSRIFYYSIVLGTTSLFLVPFILSRFQLKYLKHSKLSFYLISLILLGLSLFVTVSSSGSISFDAFDLTQNYSIRSSNSVSPLVERLRNLSFYVVLPTLISHSILSKRNLWFLLWLSISVLFFLISASKFAFAFSILSAVLALIFRVSKKPTFIVLQGLLGICIFGVFVREFEVLRIISNLVIFRPLEIPAWLNFVYYDYFSNNGLIYLSETFPSIIEPQYDTSAPRLIGNYLFPDDGTSWANVGLWGDAYINIGLLGPLLYGTVAGIIFWFYDSLVPEKHLGTFSILIILMTFYLANGSLLTILSSRGLIFAIFMAWIYGGYKFHYSD